MLVSTMLWLAALAYLCSGEPGEATSEAINAGHKLLAATFVYGSSHAFDQIIYTGAAQHRHSRPPDCLQIVTTIPS